MSLAIKRRGESGQSTVEFAVTAFLLFVLLLSALEIGRMVLVYTTVANAARAGVRYAVVHGNSRSTGSGVTNASGPAGNPAQVVTVTKNFASAGLLSTGRLVIAVTYPGGSNAPGQFVSITVKYPYDPLTTYFPLRVNLGSTAQGVIVY